MTIRHSASMQGDFVFDNSSQDNAVSYEIYTHAGAFAAACRLMNPACRVSQNLSCAESSGDQLQNLQLGCMATALPYLTNYIWQQDPFILHSSAVSKSPWSTANAQRQHNRHADQSVPEHLWGVTRFGDNIEDEWFILWLLNQITNKVRNALYCP